MAHLPDDDLPSQFDVIVDGTGLVQSVVAAALARVGQSVLHIDRNVYYGEHWGSLMHRELEQWIGDQDKSGISNLVQEDYCSSTAGENQSLDQHSQNSLGQEISTLKKTDEKLPDMACLDEDEKSSDEKSLDVKPEEKSAANDSSEVEISWSGLGPQKRRFNFDILPKVLFCRGSLVELLTQSNCGRYVEFKAINDLYVLCNGSIDKVPCSRSDVFSSTSVSMLEKRKLMKFLTFCSEFDKHPDQYKDLESLPYVAFLRQRGLTDNLIHYIIHSIAMVEETTPTLQALEATQLFLMSLGRFGNAPFLYPIYGGGELAQAFCRLCAVFGGVYCLHRTIQSFVLTEDKATVSHVMCSNGQEITCSSVVCSATHLSQYYDSQEALFMNTRLSRGIFITNGPLKTTSGKLCILAVPPYSLGPGQASTIHILQLDPSTNACVSGTYMIHMVCASGQGTAQDDLRTAAHALFNNKDSSCSADSVQILWSLYFNVSLNKVDDTLPSDIPSNVYVTSDPDSSLHYQEAIREARAIFNKMCPGEEFLAPPPDPEDIVYDDQATPPDAESTLPDKIVNEQDDS